MKTKRKKALAIISGGLDSTVALHMAAKKHTIAGAVFFHYGQKAFAKELAACRKLMKNVKAPLITIDISWIGRISASALTEKKASIPLLTEKDLSKKSRLLKTADKVMVQNRNMIFISCAAGIAAEKGCSVLVTGFNAEEAGTFPDNSSSFLESINKTLAVSLKPKKVRVVSPTIRMDKTDIVQTACKEGFDLSTVYSCYLGRKQMCGRCESCVRLLKALSACGAAKKSKLRFEIR